MSSASLHKCKWPEEYYACKVVNFFIVCDKARSLAGGPKCQQLWVTHFPDATQPIFPQQHADRHRARWKAALPELQWQFLQAKKTKAGLWNTFMMKQPHLDAACNAAQKQLHCVQKWIRAQKD